MPLRRRFRCRILVVVLVEFLEYLLDVCKLRLGLLDNRAQLLLRLLLRNVLCARVVLQLAVVLDLLARVFDLGQAERRGGAFEEVAELAKLLEVFALLLLSAMC
jgi:hypothetical protein